MLSGLMVFIKVFIGLNKGLGVYFLAYFYRKEDASRLREEILTERGRPVRC